MSDKLFYNVPKEKAGSFKSTVSNAIGFVAQTETEGYMIANGKEFGKMRVSSSANTFDVNGTQYSIIVNDDGALSVSKYIKSTISSLNVTQTGLTKSISYTINGTAGTASDNVSNKKLYIGDTYSFTTSLSGTGTFTTTVSVSNSTLNNFKIKLSYYGASEITEYAGNDKSKTLTATHIDSTVSYSISKTGTAAWGTNPSISGNNTSYTIVSAYAKAELYEGANNVDSEFKNLSVSLLTVTTQVHGIYKTGVSNVYTENADNSISLVSPSEVTSKPTSVTIPAGTPIFVFPEVWGTPTFKQLGATDTGWTLSATKTHKTTGKGTCSCKIYTHGKINSEGTWSVSW